MIFTLAWKEVREHQSIWLTMVVMSIALGLGLSKVVALGDATLAAPVAALTILGLAATYGVVCGAMMFAGEHEGGTLVFLDIFLGHFFNIHFFVHRGCYDKRCFAGQHGARQNVVRQAVGELRDDIRGSRRHQDQVGPFGKLDMNGL